MPARARCIWSKSELAKQTCCSSRHWLAGNMLRSPSDTHARMAPVAQSTKTFRHILMTCIPSRASLANPNFTLTVHTLHAGALTAHQDLHGGPNKTCRKQLLHAATQTYASCMTCELQHGHSAQAYLDKVLGRPTPRRDGTQHAW